MNHNSMNPDRNKASTPDNSQRKPEGRYIVEGGYKIDRSCLYYKEHTWVRLKEGDAEGKTEGNTATVGLTDFAQKEMGAISMADLPEPGDDVVAGKPFGTVESGKWVQKLYSPCTGVVKAVNKEAVFSSSIINTDPYGKGWLIEVVLSERIEREKKEMLMSPEEYARYCLTEQERIRKGERR